MLTDLAQRPYLHHRSPDAPEVIVSEPLRFVAVARPLCAVCHTYPEGDACAHHACPGRSLKPRAA